jgi:two-component system, OmpR family, sensor kinase
LSDREKSYALLQEFTADAAHELRTPLTILKGELQVTLMEKSGVQSEEVDVLESNLEEVERLIRVVEDLFFLAQVDQKDAEKSREEIEVIGTLREVIARLDPAAKAKGITIDEKLQSPLLLQANASQIERMFYNILENAIKYCFESGVIDVTQPEPQVIAVTDHGPGIPEADLPHLKLTYPIFSTDFIGWSALATAQPGALGWASQSRKPRRTSMESRLRF